MARSPITVLIIICFLVLLFAYPTFAQVPEWRTSLSDDTISSIALSSNGDYVVIGSTKGEVHLFTRKGTEVRNFHILVSGRHTHIVHAESTSGGLLE